MVSVCVITYNHERFIAKCLDGILSQITNFEFEIIIGDDNSLDDTRLICEMYAKRHGNKINLLPKDKNLGVQKNLKRTLSQCNKEYVALCEGDDYWTDLNKLQKQIDFLEVNQQYSLCCCRYDIHNIETNETKTDGNDVLFPIGHNGISFNKHTFFDIWLTKTLTVVFRKESFNIKLINHYRYFRDTHLFYHILNAGDGFCMNFKGGIYNLHENGVWGKKKELEKLKIGFMVFRELIKHNPDSLKMRVLYYEIMLKIIHLKIEATSMPLFNPYIHWLCLQYLLGKKNPGFYFLKIRQLYNNTFVKA
jgi:glycosyltransferase involved in cell wall biosynthesis